MTLFLYPAVLGSRRKATYLETHMARSRTIKITPATQAKKPSPKQVLSLIKAIVLTQIGEDDAPSPLLREMVASIGADADDVELAQDIVLLGLEVMDAIGDAVEAGDPKRVIFSLMSIIGSAIPELEADIAATKR